MKRIQIMIPDAIAAAKDYLLEPNGTIKNEFNGYISSLGASIISAGLLPSIIFYSQKGESADRNKIITCIEAILRKHGYPKDFSLLNNVKVLYTGANNQPEINRLTDRIFDAAIALKLSIRTFPKSKKGQS